jgi:hypothetical protein
MPTTAVQTGLQKTITDELRSLRLWRQMGDDAGVERVSAHIDEMLDRLRRYSKQGTAT